MYCPRCGQQQASSSLHYCSRCGFAMAGVQESVQKGGLVSGGQSNYSPGGISPKKRGVKQGAIMFLAGMIVTPLLAILSEMVGVEPIAAGVAAIILFWGGILRAVYALIFQPGTPTSPEKAGFFESLRETFLGSGSKESASLPPSPANYGFAPQQMNWRETGEIETVERSQNVTSRIGRN